MKKEDLQNNNTEEKENNNCEKLKEHIEQLELELEQVKKTNSYLAADLENFRKRSEKNLLESINHTKEKILLDILAIMDNFERAFEKFEVKEEKSKTEPDLTGFEQIHKLLDKLLTQNKIAVIDTQGKNFDPKLHEAVMQVDSPDAGHQGEIVQVLQKGYLIESRLLRPAKVSIKS